MSNNNFGDILSDKYAGLQHQQSTLQKLQAYLDEQFGPGSCTVALEKNGLVVRVSSSAVASQLWQRQVAVQAALQAIAPELVTAKFRVKPN